jgi:multidrug efflux pump subunit AcrB
MGKSPQEAAEMGGNEVALPVLASTLTTAIVFFPVLFLYGVSRYLFTALALAVVISLLASYLAALTVVPLFCARYLQTPAHGHGGRRGWAGRFLDWFDGRFAALLGAYGAAVAATALRRPARWLVVLLVGCAAAGALAPRLGVSFFPRTDPGQFVISLKTPAGSNLAATERETERIENIIRGEVAPEELDILVSNLGNVPDFAAMYSPNAGQNTGFVQVSLRPGHRTSSFEYMRRVRARLRRELPHIAIYFQAGGLVDSIVNMGLPAPIDVQISGSNLRLDFAIANRLAGQIRQLPGVSDAFIPQDIDAPALRLDFDRQRVAQLGLTQREAVQNVITALTSSQMIAPSF